MTKFKIAAVLYGLIAIVTFGYAAENASPCYIRDKLGDRVAAPCESGLDAVSGVISALMWPLYWSWELQS